jgi:prephenate dehydrogenase
MIACVIGGTGTMGKVTAHFLTRHGFETYVISRDKKKAQKSGGRVGDEDEIRIADMVVVSVPIPETAKVCGEISPIMKKGSLLVDLSSIKEPITREVLKKIPPGVEYLSMHQMFPGLEDWEGQNVILCPVRCSKKWLDLFREMLAKEGAAVHIMTPYEHDEETAVTQVARHILTLAFGDYLETYHRKKEFATATPEFKRLLEAFESLKSQKEMVYSIQRMNRFGKEERKRILGCMTKLIGEVEK